MNLMFKRFSSRHIHQLLCTGSALKSADCTLTQVLQGSPFSVVVAPAAADPAKCTAAIAPTDERSIEAGKELLIITQLYDHFGNITEVAGTCIRHNF